MSQCFFCSYNETLWGLVLFWTFFGCFGCIVLAKTIETFFKESLFVFHRRNKVAKNRTEENSSDIFCCWHQRCFPSNSILVQIHLSLCRSVKLGRCWYGHIVWHDLILKNNNNNKKQYILYIFFILCSKQLWSWSETTGIFKRQNILYLCLCLLDE